MKARLPCTTTPMDDGKTHAIRDDNACFIYSKLAPTNTNAQNHSMPLATVHAAMPRTRPKPTLGAR
eukprot:5263960-Lingulodinium_polyedra.AAC.1